MGNVIDFVAFKVACACIVKGYAKETLIIRDLNNVFFQYKYTPMKIYGKIIL